MEKSKLVILLRTLGVWELRNLRELVTSPFFNKQEIVVKLLDFLEGYLRKGKLVPEMEAVHKKLWPKLDYDHQRLRYVMTDLTRLVEEFFVQRQLEKKPLTQERLLLEAYAERKQEKFFDQNLGKALDKQEKDGFRDSDYLYHRFRLHETALVFEQSRKEKTDNDWLHQILADLRQHYTSSRLRYVCDLVAQSNGQVPEQDKELVNDLRKRLGKTLGNDFPAIAIYETVLAMLTHADPELYYRKLRMQLRSMAAHFHNPELAQLYSFALNYSIQQLNRSRPEYLRDIFDLYKEQLEGRILYEGEILPPQHFKNIVTVGLRLKEYHWTQKFITEASRDLPEGMRDNAMTYNTAALNFVLGDYGLCRSILQPIDFVDFYYAIDSKVLLLKSYYELAEFESLLTHCQTFEAYLTDNRGLSEQQRNPYLNLVRFTNRLVRIRMGDRKPLGALIGEIQAAREVADLRWLRQKVDDAAVLIA